ncbi:MAG: hypothetical protein ABEJ83_00355 [Candidatus Nanohaloarchaea archaeon]
MEPEKLGIQDYKVLAAAAFILLFWMLTPLYLQSRYGVSAVKTSFAITVLYFVGFKLWQLKN